MDNSNFYYCFDYALFFPDPAGNGGTVRLYGWANYSDADGWPAKPESIELLIKNDVLSYPVDFPREYESPGKRLPIESCGFDVIHQVNRPLENLNPMIRFRLAGNAHQPTEDLRIIDSRDFLKQSAALQNLDELSRQKVENLFLNEAERLNHAVELTSKPIFLHIDPAFGCQLDCPHCHGRDARKAGFHLPNMTTAIFDRIVEYYGDTLIVAFLYNWGEPLLNKHFIAFTRRLKEKRCVVRTSTNFSLALSDQFIGDLVTSGLDEITFSIDGATQETYEKYRKDGNLDLILKNIERLVGVKKHHGSRTPFLRWQYLRFPWNQDEIDIARKRAGDLGVDAFSVHPGGIFNYDYTKEDFALRENVTAERTEEIHRRYQDLEKEQRARGRYFGCDHLYRGLTIFSDGSIKPCCKVFLPKDSSGSIEKLLANTLHSNSPLHLSGRGNLRDLSTFPLSGYEPCINCVFMFPGHVHIGLDFHQFLVLAEQGHGVMNELRAMNPGV